MRLTDRIFIRSLLHCLHTRIYFLTNAPMVISIAKRSTRYSIMKTNVIMIFILWMMLRNAKCAAPGTFFWQPRLGIDMSVPTTLSPEGEIVKGKPSVSDIKTGYAVLVSGYELGTTALALAMGQKTWEKFPHLNPFKAWFYTTAYRWLLRHLSIYPEWLQGGGYSYPDTHRVWRKRFTQLETFVPSWLQRLLPHVWEWRRERKQFRRYMRYVEPSFGKHYHYPKAVFDDWKSEKTTETIENFDIENRSIDVNFADY